MHQVEKEPPSFVVRDCEVLPGLIYLLIPPQHLTYPTPVMVGQPMRDPLSNPPVKAVGYVFGVDMLVVTNPASQRLVHGHKFEVGIVATHCVACHVADFRLQTCDTLCTWRDEGDWFAA